MSRTSDRELQHTELQEAWSYLQKSLPPELLSSVRVLLGAAPSVLCEELQITNCASCDKLNCKMNRSVNRQLSEFAKERLTDLLGFLERI
jgi:hypothetical protein